METEDTSNNILCAIWHEHCDFYFRTLQQSQIAHYIIIHTAPHLNASIVKRLRYVKYREEVDMLAPVVGICYGTL